MLIQNRPIRVLIAEDERDIRDLIVLTLEFSGFEVGAAVDGEEAIEMAAADKFDLFLLDVRMPGLDGYQVCQYLRNMNATKEKPVLFLSAKGQETEIEAGYDSGADGYILKPFSPEQLIGKIRSTLDEYGHGQD